MSESNGVIWKIISGIAVLTVAALSFKHFSGRAQSQQTNPNAAAAPRPINVQFAPPERHEIWKTITLTGDVMAINEATLYAKTAGYLKAIYVDKGDRVSRGQLLAVIDAPELKSEAQQYVASLKGSQSSFEGMRAGQQRALEDVREADAMAKKSEAEFLESQRGVAKSEAGIKSAQATQAKALADVEQYRAALAKAQQDQKRSEATLRECGEDIRTAQAVLEQAKSAQKIAKITYDRYKKVHEQDPGLIAAQLVDEAQAKYDEARGKVAAAEGKIASLRFRVEAAQSEVESAKRQIEVVRAQTESAHRQIEVTKSQVEIARSDRSVAEAKTETAQQQIEAAKSRARALARQADVVKSQVNTAQSSVAAARSAKSRFADLVQYTEIRAPFAGVITKRFVDAGALIQTAANSQTAKPIVQLMDPSRVRVYAHVPEVQTPQIKVGQPVELSVDALPDVKFEGAVTRIASALEPSTRTMLAEVDVANADRKLLPGMFARVKFKLEQHNNALVIPLGGMLVEKTGRSVFVVVGDKANKVPLKTGFEDDAFVEVLEGLKGDEKIVVVGKEQLQPGAAVAAKPFVPAKK